MAEHRRSRIHGAWVGVAAVLTGAAYFWGDFQPFRATGELGAERVKLRPVLESSTTAPAFDYLKWLHGRATGPPAQLQTWELPAVKRWQREQREIFLKRFVFPYEGAVQFRNVAEERLSAKSLQREWHVELEGSRLFRFFELRPSEDANRRLPAVVLFMGHGKVRQLFDRSSYQRGAATELVRLGYAVYVMENVAMGPSDEPEQHKQLDQSLSSSGYTWYSLLFAHQRMLLLHVFNQPNVDTSRVGVAGVSTGGLLALTAAALEPRVRAASVHGIFASLADSFGRDHAKHCSCGTIDGLYPEFDLPRLALLVAPRALHVNNNQSDTFPPADAERALVPFQALQQRLGGPPARFTSPPGKHSFALEQAKAFLSEVVPPGAASEPE